MGKDALSVTIQGLHRLFWLVWLRHTRIIHQASHASMPAYNKLHYFHCERGQRFEHARSETLLSQRSFQYTSLRPLSKLRPIPVCRS